MGNCCYRKKTSLEDYILFDKEGCSYPYCNNSELDIYNNMNIVRFKNFIYCSKQCIVKHRNCNFMVINSDEYQDEYIRDTI